MGSSKEKRAKKIGREGSSKPEKQPRSPQSSKGATPEKSSLGTSKNRSNTQTPDSDFSTRPQRGSTSVADGREMIYQDFDILFVEDDASQTFSSELASKNYQPVAMYEAPIQQSNGHRVHCPYHRSILQLRSVSSGGGCNSDPMTRWQMEQNSEQSAIVRMQDGQLSLHKECRCQELVLWETDSMNT